MEQTERRFAVLIDADNISPKYIPYVLTEVSAMGVATYKRLYGDLTEKAKSAWRAVALENSIYPVHQYGYTSHKNSTDINMVIDAMDILYSGNVDGFCLVTSDSDFTRLAQRLREAGMLVVGMGESKTPKAFRSACDSFKMLDVISRQDLTAAGGDNENITSRRDIKDTIFAVITERENQGKSLCISEAGNLLAKKYPEFDVRNYGYSKLSTFLRSFDVFDLEHRGDTLYISERDKTAPLEAIQAKIVDVIAENGGEVKNLSVVKDALKETFPSFNVKQYGFRSFNRFVDSFEMFCVEDNGVTMKGTGKAADQSVDERADSEAVAPEVVTAEPAAVGVESAAESMIDVEPVAVSEERIADPEPVVDVVVTELVPEAEAPVEEAPKPKASRRTPRKRKTAAKPAVEEEPAAEEAPKPKRRTTRKKKVEEPVAEETSADTAAPSEPEAVAEESSAPVEEAPAPVEEAPKPKKRTTRKKKAEPAPVDEPAAEVVEPAAEEEPAVEEAPKPKKRVARKKKAEEPAPTEEPAIATAEPAAEEEPAVEEAPKPKRRTTRKKKVEEPAAEVAEPAAPSEPEAVAEETPKPKKRTTRKKKAEPAPAEEPTAEVVEPAAAAEPAAEEAPKPKRRTTRKKKTEEPAPADEAVVEAADSAAEVPVEEKPKPKRRTTRKKKTESSPEAEPAATEE